MAHLETVQTGTRVITYVQGRVYRHQGGVRKPQTLGVRIQPAARQRRRVCLLSANDAYFLESYSISQPCHGDGCRHSHFTRDRIEFLVHRGDLRWVGKNQNVAAWVNGREWRAKMSQGMNVMQLVECGR